MSTFQCEEINVNPPNQDQEEQEMLQDQHQRNAELNDLLYNAFGDLSQNNSSIYSSDHGESDKSDDSYFGHHSGHTKSFERDKRYLPARFPVNYHVNQPSVSSNGIFDPQRSQEHLDDKLTQGYVNAEGDNQLKILYDVKTRQLESLRIELAAEKEENQKILMKLRIAEGEKNGILATLQKNNELLVESREEIERLQSQTEALKSDIMKVEASKKKTESELMIATSQIMHLEGNIALMEKLDPRRNSEKAMNDIIESLRAKHEKEVNQMQSELDEALIKINEKDILNKQLEDKMTEMVKAHRNNLFDNCESTIREEAVVKKLLSEANEEKLRLMKKCQSLEDDYKLIKEDLDQFVSVRSSKLFDSSSSDDTDSVRMMNIGRSGDEQRKNLSDKDTISKLKSELHRALLSQESKRKLIEHLQKEVKIKEDQLRQKREEEKIYLMQTEKLKEDIAMVVEKLNSSGADELVRKHSEEVSKLKEELSEAELEKSQHQKRVKELEEQVEHLQNQILNNQILGEQQGSEYLRFHDKEVAKVKEEAQKALQDKDKEWKDKLEEALSDCNKVKQLYLEISEKKQTLLSLLQEEKKHTAKLLEEKQELQRQINALKEDLKQLEDHVLLLNEEKRKSEDRYKMENTMSNASMLNFVKEELGKLKSDEKVPSDPAGLTDDDVELLKRKYAELENRLQSSFEATMTSIKEENVKLQNALKEKEEALVNLQNKLALMTPRKNLSPDMDVQLPDRLNTKALQEIERLEKEVERLKALEQDKNDEILNLKASFQKKLEDEMESLEVNLSTKHAKEMSELEERLKNLTFNYYKEEMEKIRDAHNQEIEEVKKGETQKIEEFKKIMLQKENEIKQGIESKQQIAHLQNVIQENRVQAGLMMTRWAKEVNEIKERSDATVREAEELRQKLKSARKAALSYKKRLEDFRASSSEKYANLVRQLVAKFETAIVSKEEEIMAKLNQIEEEYKNKEEALLKRQAIRSS